LFPKARIIEFSGASELSFVAWTEADAALPDAVVGRPFANVEVQIRRPPDALAGDAVGLIYVRSPMVFMDYVAAGTDDSACLRDGDWLSVRDMGYLDAQGRLCLVGRQNRMIVTRAKKLFPEELESVLMAHPAIARASVLGCSDALRGQSVVALLQWSPQAQVALPSAAELSAWCRSRLQAYKVPRRFYVCTAWAQTVSGKTDHRALEQVLVVGAEEGAKWLQVLR
jgi:long-chain acyl-CoA synthetase